MDGGFPVAHAAAPLLIVNVFEHLDALDVDVRDSPARGRRFFCSGPFPAVMPVDAHLGVDMLYLPPGTSFPLHVHPGHHLLFIVHGEGTVTLDGTVYPTRPGDLYLIDAELEHGVGAGPSGHWILSFGAPHKEADAGDRMRVMEGA